MLRIEKGKPWVFFPQGICDMFPDKPGNLILTGDNYFKFELKFKIVEEIEEQKTLFAIIPRYTGLDLHQSKMVFTITCEDTVEHIDIPSVIQPFKEHSLKLIHKPGEGMYLYIDGMLMLNFNLTKHKFGTSEKPHIIFGAGNFPKNGFNLNYLDVELYEFSLYDETTLLSHHLFKEFIFNKSVDLTDNCNFLHRL